MPILPDSIGDEVVYGLDTVDRAYTNLAEAVAHSSPPGSAVQFRLHSESGSLTRPTSINAAVMGAASSKTDAEHLAMLVLANLPTELHVNPCDQAGSAKLVTYLDATAELSMVEVRRRLEEADPLRLITDPSAPHLPFVLRWSPERFALRKSVELLSRQSGRAVICLHMQASTPSESLLDTLTDTVQILREDPARRLDDLSTQILSEAIRDIRDLPRAALHVRVAYGGHEPPLPGLLESIGMDLTGPGGFELIASTPDETMDARELFSSATSIPWGISGMDRGMREMIHLTPADLAGRVVRFPQPPVGGLPAMASEPLSTLPRSPQRRAFERNGAPSPVCTIGRSSSGGSVDLTLSELNRHVLVAGLPGFGKTQTIHTILASLWRDHRIPFLVLDPAKSDYGDLADLLADSGARRVVLGPETPAFNPFVVPVGCTIEAHAARVTGAFDTALRLSESWPFGYIMLTRGIYRAYELATRDGTSPTLKDLYRSIGDIVRTARYDDKVRSQVTGSLLGRLETLVRGPLGAGFLAGPDSGLDWEDLLSRPTIIEFRKFAGTTERSLVFGLLIAGLASYREGHPPPGSLSHVTVLEEAHRVLADRDGVQSEGIRLLAEAVAELRGSGEGFIICDQAPSTLDPVVRKVTGSLICHRIVDRDERDLIGNSLLLSARQNEDLARLDIGEAVVYGAQRAAPTVALIERAVHTGSQKCDVSDSLVLPDTVPLPCIGCPSMCTAKSAGDAAVGSAPRPLDNNSLVALIDGHLRRYEAGEISGAEAWCGASHLLTLAPDAGKPIVFLATLSDLQTNLSRIQARRVAARRKGADAHVRQ
ncbi:ATP-binding protein [uncultured Dietzia sp.]|uniref:ATP-binding protein n=1 Tax=uncultured Dietzia sp. TaxID=395519 RepID=UPI00262644B5|nr:DUF87 domain-containing protein [uncultured Dietzia sp.]HMT49464.1 DUF87 domain-containing protein [Dietzia sp.]